MLFLSYSLFLCLLCYHSLLVSAFYYFGWSMQTLAPIHIPVPLSIYAVIDLNIFSTHKDSVIIFVSKSNLI